MVEGVVAARIVQVLVGEPTELPVLLEWLVADDPSLSRDEVSAALEDLIAAGLVVDGETLALTKDGVVLQSSIRRFGAARRAASVASVLPERNASSGLVTAQAWEAATTAARERYRERLRRRLSIVDGLITAIENGDEASRLIRSAPDRLAACEALSRRFALAHHVAQHVLDMTYGRQTEAGLAELRGESELLRAELDEYP